MLFKDTVDLIQVTDGKDADGYPENTETVRPNLFANKKPVRSSEFHQAAAQGIRLDVVFEIRLMEFKGEEFLNYGGKRYSIERTYERGELIELICQSKGVNHGS